MKLSDLKSIIQFDTDFADDKIDAFLRGDY